MVLPIIGFNSRNLQELPIDLPEPPLQSCICKSATAWNWMNCQYRSDNNPA